MIREKIFRLHRHKSSSSSFSSSASAQKFDFTFSNIQANQVPKGWDKIYVSLISSESGKTVRKSGKVAVKNGTCQWTETFAESIWISDIHTSKQMEECLLKFLVATGSSKSSILGETALNLAAFLSSESPVLVSLPLKKCNHGTVLQVEVKCLTPKTNPRDEKWKGMHAAKDENIADQDSIENQSVVSDSTTAKSSESLSSNNVARPMDAASRETSFSASVSRYSFDSMDESVGRQSFSSQSERFGGSHAMGRQDSIESNESASYGSYSVRSVRSHQSPFMKEGHGRNQREEFRKSCHAAATSLQLSSRDDATVQELEAEARMWEQNARKLAVEMERLRDELSDQNLSLTKVNMELAASRLECQELTQEIEQLKSLVEESEAKQNAAQNSEIQELGRSSIQKELEDEIRFQKEENENLCLQLDKTQESNIELISVLQEMEETIDKQKIEIERLSANDQISFNDGDLGICEMSAAETPRESSCTALQEELQRALQGEISALETAFQEKMVEIGIEEDMKNRVVKEFVDESNHILAEKEQQIMNLEAALSSAAYLDRVDGRKEIELLKEKVRGLEADCSELTEENLELLYELEESRKSKNGNVYHHNTADQLGQPVEESEKTEILQEEIADLEDIESIGKDGIFVSECSSKSASEAILISSSLASHEMRLMESENNQTEMMKHLSNLQEENIYLLQRVSGLEAQLRYLTDRSEASRLELQHSESQVMILEKQIKRLEEENESQKFHSNEKLLEMQKQMLESEEECISLGQVNIRLQSATESIMEEYNSLQKFNGELREEKRELQSRCMALESRARTFQDCRCSSAESTADLRVKCSLLRSDNENKVVLTSDQEKLLIMFESVMDSESKLKSIINELDLNLELSEAERLRLAEENSLLHMQLEKASALQSDISALRVTVQELKSRNQKLEAELKSVSRDYEEVKHEKVSMVEKICSMQRAVKEEEDCRRKRNALEEKILRLEGDLIARDALSIQDAEMRNELNRIKIVNSQLLMKVKHLENGKEEEGLEQEPEKRRKAEEICSKSTSESHDSCEISHKQDSPATDYESRILLLENELARALLANGAYKSQLESDEAVPSKKSTETNETGKTGLKISQLEAELEEIQDRYFQMSLNYAEVEAEREQLVMKLRALGI